MSRCRAKLAFIAANWSVTTFLALVLLVPSCLTGCGKDGVPTPDYTSQIFMWKELRANVNQIGCIGIVGSVTGEKNNIDFVTLELQALDESCAGCPFVAQESTRIDASTIWESPESETFRFVYCPASSSDTYRWRLTGRNVFISQPPVVSPVRLVSSVMNLENE